MVKLEPKCQALKCWNNVIVYPSGNAGTFCESCVETFKVQSNLTAVLNQTLREKYA